MRATRLSFNTVRPSRLGGDSRVNDGYRVFVARVVQVVVLAADADALGKLGAERLPPARVGSSDVKQLGARVAVVPVEVRFGTADGARSPMVDDILPLARLCLASESSVLRKIG